MHHSLAERLIDQLLEKPKGKRSAVVYPNPDALALAAGEYWTSENLGMDPEVNTLGDVEYDMQPYVNDELRVWIKKAKKAMPQLLKAKLPLTIANLDKFSH